MDEKTNGDTINNSKDKDNNNKELLSQFCDKFNYFDSDWSSSARLEYSIDSISMSLNEIINHDSYKIIWNDYLSIQNKLIDGKLKEILLKSVKCSNSNSNDEKKEKQEKGKEEEEEEEAVKYLYSKLVRTRNACGLLPIKSAVERFDNNHEEYISMIERFSDTSNSNKNIGLRKFCIIHNGLVNLFIVQEQKHLDRNAVGFDAFVAKNVEETSNDECKDWGLAEFCQLYLLNCMVLSGVFGDYKQGDRTPFELIKNKIFNGSFDSLSKLMEYCVQDITENKNVEKCLSIYKINKPTGTEKKNTFGFAFYILNRLSFVLFHDLYVYNYDKGSNGNNNNKNNDMRMIYPSLIKFYQFMYNFCVYFHYYPNHACKYEYTNKYHLFYVQDYYKFRKQVYTLDKSDTDIDIGLNKFCYNNRQYCYRGTILHGAAKYKFSTFVQLLIKDGFDHNKKNEYGVTPIKLARGAHDAISIRLMENFKNEDDAVNDKSLELRYNQFNNQLISSIYMLKKFGIKDINRLNEKLLNVKHEVLTTRDYRYYKDCYWDDLYVTLTDMKGLDPLKEQSVNVGNILETVIALIKLKVPLSDDILVLCGIYANYCCRSDSGDDNNDNANSKQLGQEYFKVILDTIKECLNGQDNNFKTRNYMWFKRYLLNSNIWLILHDNDSNDNSIETESKESTEEKNNGDVDINIGITNSDTNSNSNSNPRIDGILFDSVVKEVNKLLVAQKQFIWDGVQKSKQENEMLFKQLCLFGQKETKHNSTIVARQDRIENGILANPSELEMLIMNVELGEKEKDYNITFENNTKIYLTKCLTFAHFNIEHFNDSMRFYFQTHKNCQRQKAPVKLYHRCLIKSTTDYAGKGTSPCSLHVFFI